VKLLASFFLSVFGFKFYFINYYFIGLMWPLDGKSMYLVTISRIYQQMLVIGLQTVHKF